MPGCSALTFTLLCSWENPRPPFVLSCGLITISQKDCFKIFPIMLALCLMLSKTYYAQYYAGMIGLGLPEMLWHNTLCFAQQNSLDKNCWWRQISYEPPIHLSFVLFGISVQELLPSIHLWIIVISLSCLYFSSRCSGHQLSYLSQIDVSCQVHLSRVDS